MENADRLCSLTLVTVFLLLGVSSRVSNGFLQVCVHEMKIYQDNGFLGRVCDGQGSCDVEVGLCAEGKPNDCTRPHGLGTFEWKKQKGYDHKNFGSRSQRDKCLKTHECPQKFRFLQQPGFMGETQLKWRIVDEDGGDSDDDLLFAGFSSIDLDNVDEYGEVRSNFTVNCHANKYCKRIFVSYKAFHVPNQQKNYAHDCYLSFTHEDGQNLVLRRGTHNVLQKGTRNIVKFALPDHRVIVR